MGVKDLWNILSVSCEKKSLWELQGQTIAIDLSSWIVDSQNVKAVDKAHMNMYLRNLFFRTSYLLLLGVKPVFILEGKAPVVKHDTIARRQKTNKESENPPKAKSGNRGRLNVLQKKCEELLMSLGVRCYKSEGEAEALCAKLNELGEVDAVISQDSDCFLYGARVVLRNFTMNPSYTCDMYTMDNIEAKLGLGRQKLLALSLLCGCDYEAGVDGVGKQSALKFLATLPDNEVLTRLRSWKDNPVRENCVSSQMTLEEKLEYNIRKKTQLDPNFPSEEVISEFLSFSDKNLPKFEWVKPCLPKFVMIADRMLAWDQDYICSKFVPLVTRWHLLNGGAECGLKLESIVKTRKLRSTACYELQWQFDGIGDVSSVEPCHLIESVYPDIHTAYVKSKEKPKKGRKKKNKKDDDMEELQNSILGLSIVEQPKKIPKKSSRKKELNGLQTLDRFILKNNPNLVENQFKYSTPLKSNCLPDKFFPLSEVEGTPPQSSCENPETCPSTLPFGNSLLEFDVETDDFDLSEVISTIVSRSNCNPAVNIWSNHIN